MIFRFELYLRGKLPDVALLGATKGKGPQRRANVKNCIAGKQEILQIEDL